MGIQGKFVAEITRDDIEELVRTRMPEDVFTDFKETIFHNHPKPNDEIEDLLADVISFANAFGGSIIVGIQTEDDRAAKLKPIPKADAIRIATKLKGLTIQHVNPPIVPLEIVPFSMSDDKRKDEWVVIVRIPEGQAKPHMSSFSNQTTFVIRDGPRKRSMTADEIQRAFLAGPLQSTLANLFSELRAVRALVETMNVRPSDGGDFGENMGGKRGK